MKSTRALFALAVCLVIAWPSSACADGWSLKSLWPWSSSESSKPASTAMLDGEPLVKPTSSKGFQPAKVVRKVQTGTKRMFYKTKSALSFKKSPPEQSSSWTPGATTVQRRAPSSSNVEQTGWLKGLFTPDDPPRPSSTIGDYLGQPRVPY